MAITFTNQGVSAAPDINDGTDLAAYSTSSWTPPSGELVFVFAYSRNVANTGPAIPTMTGNGITWANMKTEVRTTGVPMRITLFAAVGTGASAGVTTVDFGGEVQTAALVSFASAADVDLSGGAAAAFAQSVSGQGTATGTGTLTLAAASASGNRPISGWGRGVNDLATHRASWTELDDMINGSNRALETQYRDDAFETTASATWATNTTWVGITAELIEDVGAAPAKELRRRVGRPKAAQRASRW